MSILDLTDINSVIDKRSELIITDSSWKILYRNRILDFSDEQWAYWTGSYVGNKLGPEGFEWEEAEISGKKYFTIHSYPMENGSRLIHHVYDQSNFAELSSDLSAYAKEWKKLAACQKELMKNLYVGPSGCLLTAARYFDAPSATLYISEAGSVTRYTLYESDMKTEVKKPESSFAENRAGDIVRLQDMGDRPYLCCSCGYTLSRVGYALYVPAPHDEDKRLHSMLFNEFKLYIENAIMQKQIIFENEHDHLTGLYNKSKYSELFREVFPFGRSIAVYNMDLNYLKRTNDTLGHEAGNALLIKTSDSIKHLTGDDVYGFRMGGDEFLVVAMNVSREESERMLSGWKDKLDEINRTEEGPECVVACGLCWESAPYDLQKVMDTADSLMYKDKREIKISRGDDPDGR